MALDPDLFKALLRNILRKRGKPLEGIHLHCRNCGDQGFASTLDVARGLGGWTKLRKCKGSHYRGLCIDCTSKHLKKRRKR